MAFDESLNITHITNNLRNYESARTGFFVLEVHGLDNLARPDYTGEAIGADVPESNRIAKAEEYLRLNVLKSPVPHFSVGTEEFRRGNDVVKFATVPSWENGTITVDDIVGIDTKSILMAWLYLAYNPHTRKGGRMADYKKTASLLEYTQDYELIRTWTIDGIFVTGITEDDFDRENDGKRRMTVNFAFDRATVDLPNEQED